MKPSIVYTSFAGLAGGVAFAITNFLTFGLFGGARGGRTGLLFDPAVQSPKVIAVWKTMEPLPVLITRPPLILAAWLAFAVGHAFIYRAAAAGWPARRSARALRLAIIVWFGAAFFELMGPFNLLHEPFALQCIELAFWALAAGAEAFVIAAVLERGVPGSTCRDEAHTRSAASQA